MRIIAIISLAVTLGGCATAEERAARAAEASYRAAQADDVTCRSYGAEKGSDAYIQCRMARDQQRANARAVAASVDAQQSANTMAAGLALMQASQRRTLPSSGLMCSTYSSGRYGTISC